MEIKQNFEHVDGNINTVTDKMVSVIYSKYGDVKLCIKSNMNIPIAAIKLYSENTEYAAKQIMDEAHKLGEEIARRWNNYKHISDYNSKQLKTELIERNDDDYELENYSNDDLQEELEDRGFFVAEFEPELKVEDIENEFLIQELEKYHYKCIDIKNIDINDKFKRILCDFVNCSYQISKKDLLILISDKL